MMNPTRYTVGATDLNGGQGLYPNEKGDLVKFEDYVQLAAHAIEGAANKEFLEKQVPALKTALVKILMIASAGGTDEDMADIAELASTVLAQ